MDGFRYAVYPPAEHGLPWLAVVFKRGKPVDIFGFPNLESAEQLLVEMRARNEAKRRGTHA